MRLWRKNRQTPFARSAVRLQEVRVSLAFLSPEQALRAWKLQADKESKKQTKGAGELHRL